MEVSEEMCLDTIFLATFSTKNNYLMNVGSQSALCAACWPNRQFFGVGGHPHHIHAGGCTYKIAVVVSITCNHGTNQFDSFYRS